ncbi:hypothetical protein ABZ318_04630 [Streptomyces sp. NPDC006197]|uniref:hypothetical protein n=1 Tax=Streptomyces sp. NPDC006197 TaxID=3156685 RepID=UPI0033A92261
MAAGRPAPGRPDTDPARFVRVDRPWIGCVREPAPLGHERDVRVRHMPVSAVPDLTGCLGGVLPSGATGDRA